jgi:hypothetical protein
MYQATLIPEGPGSQVTANGDTAEAAVREAYRTWLKKDQPKLSEEDLDDILKDVKIRNGAIYDDGMPCGDVGPAR